MSLRCCSISFLVLVAWICIATCTAEYMVGIGKADITGPVADVNLMALYGDLYSSQNVAISGTHTHASPAGFLQYVIYDITSLGFIEQTFKAMVDGIVQSIQQAHATMASTTIYAASGELLGANINRSPTAYLQNPAEERAQYAYDIDKDMTLVKLVGENNWGRGAITWFPVHCTSMNNTNRLVSGDNKGAAEQFMEKWARSQRQMEPGFAAAFAQANVGDTSPNIQGAFCLDTGEPCEPVTSTCNGRVERCHGKGPAWPDDTKSTEIIGSLQYYKAVELWRQAQEEVSGPVDYRHTFLDMSSIVVKESKYTRAGRSCRPAMGFSFAAGTTDGPGAFDFKQNDTHGIPFWDMVRDLIQAPTPEQVACHAPKPILIDSGNVHFPYDWTPTVTEISLLRAGQLVILCVPGELTTMAGRRMRAALQDFVRSAWGDNLRIVVAGLTNTYASYVTTFEEYQAQRYEGAFTLYGPHTLDAYIQEMLRLADAMIKGLPIESSVQPPDLGPKQISLLTPVVVDEVPSHGHFGEVVQDAGTTYFHGDTVTVKFRSACPRNNLRTNDTFLTVERLDADFKWQVVHTDHDWSTKFLWERPMKLSTRSFATITWVIPDDAELGNYRIRHFGDAKQLLGKIVQFTGTSSVFEVVEAARAVRAGTVAQTM